MAPEAPTCTPPEGVKRLPGKDDTAGGVSGIIAEALAPGVFNPPEKKLCFWLPRLVLGD